MSDNTQTVNPILDQYDRSTHRVGRAWCAIALALLIGIPAAVCLYFDAWPPLSGLMGALISVCSIYLPVGIIEVITYSPMVGAGGSYLMFVTGNLGNLKIPCAANAMEAAKVKPGSPEGEIVSTLAIASSSIVTTLIILLGVLFLSSIEPLLQSPVLAPAFNNVLPALFGAMGFVWLRKYWKIAVVPLVLMLALFLFLDTKYLGIMIPVAAGIAMGVARILYVKKKI